MICFRLECWFAWKYVNKMSEIVQTVDVGPKWWLKLGHFRHLFYLNVSFSVKIWCKKWIISINVKLSNSLTLSKWLSNQFNPKVQSFIWYTFIRYASQIWFAIHHKIRALSDIHHKDQSFYSVHIKKNIKNLFNIHQKVQCIIWYNLKLQSFTFYKPHNSKLYLVLILTP